MTTAGVLNLVKGTTIPTPPANQIAIGSKDGTILSVMSDAAVGYDVANYWSETVTLGSDTATMRLPASGSFPTGFKTLLFEGILRCDTVATQDNCNLTVNAVATGYYQQLVQFYSNTLGVTEYLNQANWYFPINGGTATANIFSRVSMKLANYGTYPLLEVKSSGMYATTSTNLRNVSVEGMLNSNQVVAYLTLAPATAARKLVAGSYLSVYGIKG